MFDRVDPLTCTASELLAAVGDEAPGPMLMSALLMIDRSALDADDAVTFVQIHERVAAWWASVQVDALVAAASPQRLVEEFTLLCPDSDEERTIRIEDAIRDEVAAATRWSGVTAQARACQDFCVCGFGLMVS